MDEWNVPENVKRFTKKAQSIMLNEWLEDIQEACNSDEESGGISSPIEMLFYVAFKTMVTIKEIPSQCAVYSFISGRDYQSGVHPVGIEIFPQHGVGGYFIDFLITAVKYEDGIKCVNLAIELDGHEFHDRDEKQRRYEKKRDRYLAANGYTVMHFTGKEVTDNPFVPVAEVLSAIFGWKVSPPCED